MSQLPPEFDEADLHLQRLVRSDMLVVQHVQAVLLDTTDPTEVADLARAYARITRSARQHLALHARLKHDRERAAREADKHEAWKRSVRSLGADATDWKTDEEMALEERAEALSEAVGKVISKAADGDRVRHTALVHRFDRELDDWYEEEDFLDVDLDAQVVRACHVLGLPANLAARWRDLPRPTFVPDPDVGDDHDSPDDAAPQVQAAPDASQHPAAGPPPPLTDTG
jgi:hypothetical protein